MVKMKGWRRKMEWRHTKLRWIKTSPNIPRSESCPYYLASCIAQHVPGIYAGTGTPKPFQFVTTRGIDHRKLCSKLNGFNIRGVRFTPYLDKDISKGSGVSLDLSLDQDPDLMLISMAMLREFYLEKKQSGEDLLMGAGKSGLNLLYKVYGSDELLSDLRSASGPQKVVSGWDVANKRFKKLRSKYLLYD